MHFVLSKLEPRDVDTIIPICYDAFRGESMTPAFFGRENPAGYAHTKKLFLNFLKDDRHDTSLKVEDLDAKVEVDILDEKGNSTGKETRTRIVCVGNWKIYPTFVAPKKEGDQEKTTVEDTSTAPLADEKKEEVPFSYLESQQERDDAALLLGAFEERRHRVCQEPHVLCNILFSHPDYHHKGAGTMMMQWGNHVADAMLLPCWVEATSCGEPLYLKMGYEGQERVKKEAQSFTSTYYHMRRPRKVGRMVGKELVREE